MMVRAVIVTNIPAPYRLPVYALLARQPGLDVHVVFCSSREPDRDWDLDVVGFPHAFLKARFVGVRGRFIHVNPDIWPELDRLRPEIVVTTGFNPTHLLAYAWARAHGAPHVAMTDGTLESEATLTPLHRWIRRRVYARSHAFIAASEGGMRLYRSYGVDDRVMYKSPLCADNSGFGRAQTDDKRYDFIFCGRFVAVKNPLFALEVARAAALRLGRRLSIALVGAGEEEGRMRALAKSMEPEVEASFVGFVRQEDLPRWYAAARLFLFPTRWDPWGVVASEACAAGVPVLISPAAGAAGELIRDGENGFVLPLDMERWVPAAVRLLEDDALRSAMAARCRELVSEYSYENAARGIVEALTAAWPQRA